MRSGDTSLVPFMHASDAFVMIPRFASFDECERLRAFAEKNLGRLAKTNANPRYDGRVIQGKDIDDESVSALAGSVVAGTAQELACLYEREDETSSIVLDMFVLNRWDTGVILEPHADNALPDGTPNYTPHRRYGAVLYLNDDYDGGLFYFANTRVHVKPETGLLLAFKAGLEHAHGVTRVERGTRWTLPMWFR